MKSMSSRWENLIIQVGLKRLMVVTLKHPLRCRIKTIILPIPPRVWTLKVEQSLGLKS